MASNYPSDSLPPEHRPTRRDRVNSGTRSCSVSPTRRSRLEAPDASVDPSSSNASNSLNPEIVAEHWLSSESLRGSHARHLPTSLSEKDPTYSQHNDEASKTEAQRSTSQLSTATEVIPMNHSNVLRERTTLENISAKRTDSDEWSESDTIVPRRNLSVMDVAALIFNKMVGTGIFTTPGAVLALTKSKPISLVLWAVGGMYTLICVFMYLEYGTSLPFTGGELIYLDEAWPAPEMLSTIIFAGFFLILASSAGNAIAFAKHILLAAEDGTNSNELDGRLVHFFAIVIVLVVCLLHYFSNRFGMFLNRVLALFKGLLLFSVFVAGVIASRKEGSGLSDFRHIQGKHASVDSIAALVLILYAYQGWENANYVAGEIRAPTRTLKYGAFVAVGIVTLLYLLVTTGYYLACDYATITNTETDIGMAVNFGPKAFGSSFGLKICIAISALGNLISVAFTSSKVKQAIASQRFAPFWKFLQKDINSPKGALVLHWLTTVITISVIPNNADGYNFIVGLFTYGHLMVTIFIALGLYRLHSRMGPNWQPEFLTNKYVYHVLPVLFIGVNAIILGWGAKPHQPGTIPRYWWPTVNFLVFAGSALYWVVLRILQAKVQYEGQARSIGSIVGFEVRIHNETDRDTPPYMSAAMVQSRLDGSRRRVEFLFSGPFAKIGKKYQWTKDFLGEYVW